ncbi:HAD family hydrolase [Lachnospiraceae bacterium 42-17]|nr:HAD family hydrolase [Dorea sp.]
MKKLLITDLDDTLYSWINFFVPAFYEMVDALVNITGIEKNVLINEYKTIHQQYHNVEYPFSTLQLPSIKGKYASYSDVELKNILNEAFHRFNSVRKYNLKLFPGVYDTLNILYKKGIKIIGYSDSTEENGYYRLKKLGIECLFERIYLSDSQFKNDKNIIKPEKIEIVQTRKPDPDTLLQICKRENITTDDAIYVGDSLTKDVYMADCANIESIWMTGGKTEPDLYSKLVAISHWTQYDFEQEKKLKDKCSELNIRPSYEIMNFNEILDIVL